jgi:hypothetical protein
MANLDLPDKCALLTPPPFSINLQAIAKNKTQKIKTPANKCLPADYAMQKQSKCKTNTMAKLKGNPNGVPYGKPTKWFLKFEECPEAKLARIQQNQQIDLSSYRLPALLVHGRKVAYLELYRYLGLAGVGWE